MQKVVIIGASSGMGLEVAKLFLDRGCRVGVAARREDRLEALKQLAPDRVVTAALDVTADDADRRLRDLIEELGGMDLFFYSSGIGKQNRTLSPDIELNTINTNAMGFARMIGEAYRYFAEQGKGHIAAITSIAGTKGLGPAPAYSATKALQNVYLQSLEQQAHARGLKIQFTDIRPGFVNTDLLKGDFRYPMMLKPDKVARRIVSAILNKRHVVVIDWKYAILTALWRRLPRVLWRHLKL
ncbi:MAG: SDR family NAD(P)-dependent oxidoreductase [Bacteroidales bacterium]|nr:SDR family NAD(P)-dependent oxidoreductase [Bacteroidales bacterium]